MVEGELKKRMDNLQKEEIYADTNLYAEMTEWLDEAKKEIPKYDMKYYIVDIEKWFKKWFGLQSGDSS